MESHTAQKAQELSFLKAEQKKRPELFKKSVFVDDNRTLKSVGIELPGKDRFPLGYLKLWPQDFIVEEIGPEAQVYSIDSGGPESRASSVDPSHRTIYATLVKCGVSTLEAYEDILKATGARAEQVKYAGIKDRDAVTAQRLSFRDVDIERVRKISSNHFFLKDISSGKGIAQKGELLGNRFTVLIRTEGKLTQKEHFTLLAENLRKVKEDGFYNFYYLQRFGQESGTSRTNNFHWAISILHGDYEKAVREFLTSTSLRELPYFRNLRDKVADHFGDWSRVLGLLSPLPVTFANELRVVKYLNSHPGDFVGALQTIPDQIMLWAYSISSYLFNRMLSDAALSGGKIPSELPLFLSDITDDWMLYKKYLHDLGIFPPQFKNLKPFPGIQLRNRTVSVKEKVIFHSVDVVPEGIVLSFTLGKGAYATSLLSHLFNLVSGAVPESMSREQAQLSHKGSREKTIEKFKPIMESRDSELFAL